MDKYGIEVSEKCYAVGKIGKVTNKNTGEVREALQCPAYCSTIANALNALRRRIHMDAVKTFDGTLEEAVDKIKAIDDRFNAEVAKITF
jgi:hypothetical protein